MSSTVTTGSVISLFFADDALAAGLTADNGKKRWISLFLGVIK